MKRNKPKEMLSLMTFVGQIIISMVMMMFALYFVSSDLHKHYTMPSPNEVK